MLRWYQQEACAAAWASLCGQPGNPVVALPTGAGKSHVIAELCRAAVQEYRGRVLVLAHRKELLSQNAEKIGRALPAGVSLGVYSAGLGMRSVSSDVVCCGIQSVFRRAEEFGARHLVLIDEVHLVPHEGEGMYRTFIENLRGVNPKLRMVGLTATPYRTSEGSLCRADGLFQRVCYDAPIQRLIAEGSLCAVTNQEAEASVNTSGLRVRAGEFIPSDVEALFDAKTVQACSEIAGRTLGRKSVLVFCAGVAHAEHVARCLEIATREPVGVVTGETGPLRRSEALSRFRSGALRILCNVDVLTTGFDAPGIDAIAILRATNSPGLFAQICGRGLRTHPGKESCLVLDFGENIKRHGPIDAIDFGKRKGVGTHGDAPAKACPNCEQGCAAGARVCPECGWVFPPRQPNHEPAPDSATPILARPQSWIVEEVRFSRHTKKKAAGPDTLRVDYLCSPCEGGTPETISEWVCVDHDGWAGRKARKWWTARSRAEPEADPSGSVVASCVDLFNRGAVATPNRITTIQDGRWKRVQNWDLEPIPDEWLEEAVEVAPWEEEAEEAPF